MPPKKSQDVTRGHEHYLSHILMLGRASPIALKAIIQREKKKCSKDFTMLISENRKIFKTHYETEYHKLFHADKVNALIDSWDTLQLCVVSMVLFKSNLSKSEVTAIQCIHDMRKDMEKYAECAILPYNVYEAKRNTLHNHLLNLIAHITDKAKQNCKRVFYSFQPQSIKVTDNLISRLKRTNDVNCHLEIATEEGIGTNIYREADVTCVETGTVQATLTEENQVFEEELQEKHVYNNDSVVLTCKLINSKSVKVEWRKDGRSIKQTDHLMLFNNNRTHWLAIAHTTLKDSGRYSCVCGHYSTSADLTVIDETLTVLVDLPFKSEVVENRNIDVECRVNLLGRKPVWRHKGEVLKPSDRYVILSKGTVHRLSITSVTLQDEGEYTVVFGNISSKTTVLVQGNMGDIDILQRRQILQELFRNWLRGALALKYLKRGLEEFSDKFVRENHNDIVSALGSTCNTCEEKELLPHKQNQCPRQRNRNCLCSINPRGKKRKICPNSGFCGKVYDKIVFYHRFQDPLLANTDIQKWSSDPWSIATCFINTTGYKGKRSAKEVDCSGLLCLCINNINVEIKLGEVIIDGKSDVFAQARQARNDILHSPNYELSESQLNNYIKLFKDVLEIQDKHGNTPLKGEPGVEEALDLLEKVQKNQIEINLAHDIEQFKEHGLNDLEEEYHRAKKQNELKLQQMEEKLKVKSVTTYTENELQLLLNLKSTEKEMNPNEPFVFTHQIQVIAKNGEISVEGNEIVYKAVEDCIVQSIKGASAPSNNMSINKAVCNLIRFIKSVNDCKIVTRTKSQRSTCIQVKCLTYKAIEKFLECINNLQYQQELFEVRRWLQKEHGIESYDIKASCTTNDIDKAKHYFRLRISDQPRTLHCIVHHNTQVTLYCPGHNTFFCTECKETRHSSCLGIKQVRMKQVISGKKGRVVIKDKEGSYNVMIDKRFAIGGGGNYDHKRCKISSMCLLPSGCVPLVDGGNKKLKKLNEMYKVVSCCNIPLESLYSVCYIGNDTVVVSGVENFIIYVNVSKDMEIRENKQLKHTCLGLAWHGNTLYVASREGISTYDKNCEEQHFLYLYSRYMGTFIKIAVSDNGERLFICADKDLIAIDTKGNEIYSLNLYKKQVLGRDIC